MRSMPRILGIAAGILAGTIFAILMRGPIRGKPIAVDANHGPNVATIEVDVDSESEREQAPDPGRRSTILELVAAAKKQPEWLTEFEMTERSGRLVGSKELRGEPYIACFFFSTCPGTCTRQSNKMQLLQNKFKGKPIKFVSISVDPESDTPAVLQEYAEKFQADPNRWLFLTSPIEYVVRVGTEKFFLAGVEKRGHPDRFCLVNAEGDLVGSYVWLDQEEFDQLIVHANELLDKSPSKTE
jgi:protein SCO1/2